MVGGKLIEIAPHRLESGMEVLRLWVRNEPDDELAVYVDPTETFDTPGGTPSGSLPRLPVLGEEIWWQKGRVYFDHDRRYLVKVGYSFDPRESAQR